MRVLLAILALLLIGAKPAPDWLNTLAATPAGGFVMGNPKAKVKLVEYLSLTCPACRNFHLAAKPVLGPRYIATGKVSYEIRPFILNPADAVAAAIARCGSPRQFFRLTDAFLSRQEEWTAPFQTISAADRERITASEPAQGLIVAARATSLDAFARRHGATRDAATCLKEPAALDRLEALRRQGDSEGVQGTPTFFINGAKASATDWASLEPQIRQALN